MNITDLRKEADPSEVGARIRAIREKEGLSMADFAEYVDGPEGKARSGTVANWEKGKNLPNTKRLKRIAKIGYISVEELLTGVSPLDSYLFDLIDEVIAEMLVEANKNNVIQETIKVSNKKFLIDLRFEDPIKKELYTEIPQFKEDLVKRIISYHNLKPKFWEENSLDIIKREKLKDYKLIITNTIMDYMSSYNSKYLPLKIMLLLKRITWETYTMSFFSVFEGERVPLEFTDNSDENFVVNSTLNYVRNILKESKEKDIILGYVESDY